MHNLRSAENSAQFHAEHEARVGADPLPWTGSLCEQPESPRCWKTKPETEPDTIQTCVSMIIGLLVVPLKIVVDLAYMVAEASL